MDPLDLRDVQAASVDVVASLVRRRSPPFAELVGRAHCELRTEDQLPFFDCVPRSAVRRVPTSGTVRRPSCGSLTFAGSRDRLRPVDTPHVLAVRRAMPLICGSRRGREQSAACSGHGLDADRAAADLLDRLSVAAFLMMPIGSSASCRCSPAARASPPPGSPYVRSVATVFTLTPDSAAFRRRRRRAAQTRTSATQPARHLRNVARSTSSLRLRRPAGAPVGARGDRASVRKGTGATAARRPRSRAASTGAPAPVASAALEELLGGQRLVLGDVVAQVAPQSARHEPRELRVLFVRDDSVEEHQRRVRRIAVPEVGAQVAPLRVRERDARPAAPGHAPTIGAASRDVRLPDRRPQEVDRGRAPKIDRQDDHQDRADLLEQEAARRPSRTERTAERRSHRSR